MRESRGCDLRGRARQTSVAGERHNEAGDQRDDDEDSRDLKYASAPTSLTASRER